MGKCPYCGKTLEPGERFCYVCEADVQKNADEAEKPQIERMKKKK